MSDSLALAIIELPVDRWRDYRTIRLSALRTDPHAFGERYDEALAYPDALWQQRLDGTVSLVRFAQVSNQIVGLAGALLGSLDDAGRAHIVSVFVEPGHCGLGIGRHLLKRILTDLAARSDITHVRLNVTETQIAAKILYESLGFVTIGREDHPANKDDEPLVELVMERALIADAPSDG